MAIVNNQQEEDDKDKSKTPTGSFAGESSTINPSAGQPAGVQQPKGTSSGRFTNIQNYISANKQGAQNLGSNVAGNISNIGNQAKTGLEQAQNQFDTQANQGRLVRGQSDVQANNVINNAGQSIYNGGTNANQDAIKNFQRIAGGQYLGPQELQGTENLRSKAQNAQNLGNLAGTEGGRYTLLRQMYGNPQYSQGQTSLDQLLLGNQTGQLKGARQLVSTLPQSIQNAAQQDANRASAYQLESNQIGKDVTGNLNKQLGAVDSDLSNSLAQTTQKENDLQSAYNRTLQDLGKNEITNADFSRLGLNKYFGDVKGDNVERLDINLPDYIQTNAAQNVTKEGVANYGQAANLNALQQLAAQNPSLNFANVGNYKASSQTANDATLDPLAKARRAELDADTKYMSDFDKFRQTRVNNDLGIQATGNFQTDSTRTAAGVNTDPHSANYDPTYQGQIDAANQRAIAGMNSAKEFAAKYDLDPNYVYNQLIQENAGGSQLGQQQFLPKVARFNTLRDVLRVK